jgi:hypothetical protein
MKKKKISAVIFFIHSWLSKPWIRIGNQSEMLDPDQESMNPDPKHCPPLFQSVQTSSKEMNNRSLGVELQKMGLAEMIHPPRRVYCVE